MKESFLEIPVKRYVAYVVGVLILQVAIAYYVKDETYRNVLLVVSGSLFSLIGGFVGHFLVRFKLQMDLIHLAHKLKGQLGFHPDVERTDTLYTFWSRILEKSAVKAKAYAAIIESGDYVRSHFFADNPSAFEAFLRDEISGLTEQDKDQISTLLKSKDSQSKWRSKYDRGAIYADIATRAESSAKLVQDLRELIKVEEVSLRFANIFRSREFDINTPYLILGKFANIQKSGKILTDWVTSRPFIPIRASGYANFPDAIKGGNVLVYIFIPPKFYRSAEELFAEISIEYSRRKADIEQVFLVVASVFYDSSYIHIGSRIRFANSLIKGLRQFLFFKTGNKSFATGADIGKELLNATDRTTFQKIVERLPLRYYVKDLPLLTIETRALDAASSKVYTRFISIRDFIAMPEAEGKQFLRSSMDMRSLRYNKQHYKTLKTTEKRFKANKDQVVEERLAAIYQSICNGHNRFEKLIASD
ncbi:MAG: hypothetical protein F9K24_13685 [Leptonema illini]|uniref:Uncharacterized protein n=1 Tax=Leptonema illini TaxID=183 RepID=A0A833H0Y6_9LEPT|nr:MAG: hypothetical protein F9K24_13685 [Leptonema illini]